MEKAQRLEAKAAKCSEYDQAKAAYQEAMHELRPRKDDDLSEKARKKAARSVLRRDWVANWA